MRFITSKNNLILNLKYLLEIKWGGKMYTSKLNKLKVTEYRFNIIFKFDL